MPVTPLAQSCGGDAVASRQGFVASGRSSASSPFALRNYSKVILIQPPLSPLSVREARPGVRRALWPSFLRGGTFQLRKPQEMTDEIAKALDGPCSRMCDASSCYG